MHSNSPLRHRFAMPPLPKERLNSKIPSFKLSHKKINPHNAVQLRVLNLHVQVGAFPSNRKRPLKGGMFLKEGVSGSLG